MSIKRFFVKIANAYWLQEIIILLKTTSFSADKTNHPMLISVIDNNRKSQGLTDRFKGIVSVYALSKALNVPFKCDFVHPFQLSEFLVPNNYNWLAEPNEFSYNTSKIRYKILRKEPTIKKLLKVLPLKKQIRVYTNVDYLDEINKRFNKNFVWGKLFNELFKTADPLTKQLNHYSEKLPESKFIACVFRFQSLLGDFEEYKYKSLSAKVREKLIEKNITALQKIVSENDCPVLVTSDSVGFLEIVKEMDCVIVIPGKVVHMDCTFDEQNEVYLKSFIDFFMLSKAKKVFSIGTKQMYPTNFPVYAAKINNIPFERILID